MSSEVTHPGAVVRCLLAGLAVGLGSCGTTSQKMDLSQDMIATPPHRMSRTEYPFDAGGRYVDAWAAQGAHRYGRFINTDRTEDGRGDTGEPERRPLPPPRETAAKPPAPAPERPASAATRPPSTSRPDAGSSAKPPPKKSAATPAKPAAKPAAKKPAAKRRTTTHTVKRGDSLGSLSRRYGVPVQAIKKANNLKSDRIIDGRKLVIPKN